MSKELDRIDKILAKPRKEWSDQEFDFVIEWRVQSKLNDEEHQIQFAAIQETMLESAEASYERAQMAEATLADMKKHAFELLERASYNPQ